MFQNQTAGAFGRLNESQSPERMPGFGQVAANSIAKVPARQADERRKDIRRRVLKGGSLYFNKGYGVYSCRIKNLSDTGAMIEMEDSSGLPSEFDFLVGGDAKPHKATIKWRGDGLAGIRFLEK